MAQRGLVVNDKGQLGDGTWTSRAIPVQVMTEVQSVHAGYQFTIFLKKDGSAWATGDNHQAQIGDGTTTNRNTPVQVMTDVRSVYPGWFHCIYFKNNGNVMGLGRYHNGGWPAAELVGDSGTSPPEPALLLTFSTTTTTTTSVGVNCSADDSCRNCRDGSITVQDRESGRLVGAGGYCFLSAGDACVDIYTHEPCSAATSACPTDRRQLVAEYLQPLWYQQCPDASRKIAMGPAGCVGSFNDTDFCVAQ